MCAHVHVCKSSHKLFRLWKNQLFSTWWIMEQNICNRCTIEWCLMNTSLYNVEQYIWRRPTDKYKINSQKGQRVQMVCIQIRCTMKYQQSKRSPTLSKFHWSTSCSTFSEQNVMKCFCQTEHLILQEPWVGIRFLVRIPWEGCFHHVREEERRKRSRPLH